VDADGSQLIVATDVLRTPADFNQLQAAVHGVAAAVGTVQRVLADGGHVNKEAMGLRQFLLRGLERVKLEWGLVCRKAHGAPPREGSLAAELKDRGFGHSPARKTRRLTPTGS